jgi:hypothetical protein
VLRTELEERLAALLRLHAGMRSFDYATASLRDAVTPLRMTEHGSVLRFAPQGVPSAWMVFVKRSWPKMPGRSDATPETHFGKCRNKNTARRAEMTPTSVILSEAGFALARGPRVEGPLARRKRRERFQAFSLCFPQCVLRTPSSAGTSGRKHGVFRLRCRSRSEPQLRSR